ncbi:hypothetical protein Cs7R123_54350 [Catellatospora sp. TT07R-123]|uniref:CATRA conflict system CASPASE/TPR repeat-associated protein n=1 Tax=Catellatospora sp. TT07R-123 TaxID=2733863 RepID=UPI001B2CB6BB|nr:CATRA conflict system CASPASE/TPR repeat-associated protein [Catellatospora sp. TT07R-123]GHJ48093.1 hypothetical protein Cs7R123_54350 [Catellatospora sp. TT07R-123]
MAARHIVDQQLVVHLYAPTDGPAAEAAYRRLHEVWAGCRHAFAMTEAIPGTGLPSHLPETLGELIGAGSGQERAVAGQEHRGAVDQAVLRLHHDVLCLSVGLAPARPETGTWWARTDLRWRELVGSAGPSLLGQAMVYGARLDGPVSASAEEGQQARLLLPARAEAADWWQRGCLLPDGVAMWEITPQEDSRDLRRLLCAVPEPDDAQLSAWIWSDGGTAIPPLARYLLHAAKLRYLLRVWERDRHAGRGRVDLGALADRLRSLAKEPGPADAELLKSVLGQLDRLHQDGLESAMFGASLKELRLTAEIALSNMAKVVAAESVPDHCDLVADDRAVGGWLLDQIGTDLRYLDLDSGRARQVADLGAAVAPPARVQARPAPTAKDDDPDARRRVFVVHGRDEAVLEQMFEFLTAIGLLPMPWEALVAKTGKPMPHLSEVISRAVAVCQATVVLLTPDDQVSLHSSLHRTTDDPAHREPGMQARPNVLIELGLALGALPDRTLIVKAGRMREIADLAGLNFVQLDAGPDCRRKLANRLKLAGCAVDTSGERWLAEKWFTGLDAYRRGQ